MVQLPKGGDLYGAHVQNIYGSCTCIVIGGGPSPLMGNLCDEPWVCRSLEVFEKKICKRKQRVWTMTP